MVLGIGQLAEVGRVMGSLWNCFLERFARFPRAISWLRALPAFRKSACAVGATCFEYSREVALPCSDALRCLPHGLRVERSPGSFLLVLRRSRVSIGALLNSVNSAAVRVIEDEFAPGPRLGMPDSASLAPKSKISVIQITRLKAPDGVRKKRSAR